MRILIVSEVTSYMRGGVPAETSQLIRGLADRGHEVAFGADVPVPGGEAARHFPLDIPANSRLPGQVDDAVRAFDPNLVHVMAMGFKGVAQLAPVLASRPWTLTCHSIPPHERKLPALHGNEAAHYGARALRFLPNSMAWRWLFRRRVMPHVVVHSEYVKRIVLRYGYADERIDLIPLGCEIPEGGAAPTVRHEFPTGPKIVTTGGIAHTKGYHDAISALARVRRRFPGLSYQIIGELRDASYVAFLHRLIERLGLRDCVRITPNLPNDDKMRALATADLYIQPSHEEGFCLAYIEAAPLVPRLVGADTGAIRLIGEDDPGARVVPTRKPLEMAEAIESLLMTTLPSDLMPRRMQRLSQRFAWSAYLDAHEALYRRLARAAS